MSQPYVPFGRPFINGSSQSNDRLYQQGEWGLENGVPIALRKGRKRNWDWVLPSVFRTSSEEPAAVAIPKSSSCAQ